MAPSDRPHNNASSAAARKRSDDLAATYALYDRLPALIYIYDLVEQRTVYLNNAVSTLLGYAPEHVQALGDRLLAELIHPKDVERWLVDILPHYATAGDDTAIESEYRLRHADGSWRWFLVCERAWQRQANGTVRQIIGVGQDVSRRHSDVEQLVGTVLANAYDGLGFLDLCGVLLYTAPSVTTLLGYQPDELVGKSFVDYIHPDDRELAERAFVQLGAAPNASALSVCRALHRDGSWRWLELRGTNLLQHPQVGAIVVNYCDITERVQAETQLRYQAKLVENLSDAVIATDLDYVVRSWNPAAEAIYGWSAAEVIGRDLSQILSGTAFAESSYDESLRQVMEQGRWQGEVLQRRKDGTYIPIRSSVSLLFDETGAVTGLVAINQDISARRAIETELAAERALLALRVEERTAELSAANRQLEEANRLKDEFLAAVSHEFRTPMQAILGLTENLHQGLAGPLTERQERYLGLVLESGQHLLTLINDILNFARNQAGQAELDLALMPVARVCESSLRMVREQAERKQLHVDLDLDPSLHLLHADERVIKQILVNFLSNAVKFTPEGRAIGLQVRGDAAAAQVRFTVWDTGIGIAPADYERIFQPFVQLDGALSRKYGGTGLGLALAQRLAQLHNGSISVESTPGEGSRFTLSIPWVELQG